MVVPVLSALKQSAKDPLYRLDAWSEEDEQLLNRRHMVGWTKDISTSTSRILNLSNMCCYMDGDMICEHDRL